jgi:hypothetical protein
MTPLTAQEDNTFDGVWARSGVDKIPQNYVYYIPAFARRPWRIIDGIYTRPGFNEPPTTVKTDVFSHHDERFPVMRLLNDLLWCLPQWKEPLSMEGVHQAFSEFISSIPLNSTPTVSPNTPASVDKVIFPKLPFPTRHPKTVKSTATPAHLDWDYENNGKFNEYVNSEEKVPLEWTVYPDPHHPLRWYYREYSYLTLPEELVTQDMLDKALESELLRIKDRHGGNVILEADDPSLTDESLTMDRIKSRVWNIHTVYYDDQPYQLPISFLLDLISELLLDVLRFAKHFEDAFNEFFVDLSDELKELFYKSKEIELIDNEYHRIVESYQTQSAQRLKDQKQSDPAAFYQKIDFVENKPVQVQQPPRRGGRPSASARLPFKKEIGDNDDDDDNDDRDDDDSWIRAIRSLPTKDLTPSQQELLSEYEFCMLETRVLDLESRHKALRQELTQLAQNVAQLDHFGSSSYSWLDLVTMQAKNVYIDEEMGKKYTLYTNRSPTYIHLYEQPLLRSDILPPPAPVAAKLLQEHLKDDKIKEQEEIERQQSMSNQSQDVYSLRTRGATKPQTKQSIENKELPPWKPSIEAYTPHRPIPLTDDQIDLLLNPEKNASHWSMLELLTEIETNNNTPVKPTLIIGNDINADKNCRYLRPVVITHRELDNFINALNDRLYPVDNTVTTMDDGNYALLEPLSAPPALPSVKSKPNSQNNDGDGDDDDDDDEDDENNGTDSDEVETPTPRSSSRIKANVTAAKAVRDAEAENDDGDEDDDDDDDDGDDDDDDGGAKRRTRAAGAGRKKAFPTSTDFGYTTPSTIQNGGKKNNADELLSYQIFNSFLQHLPELPRTLSSNKNIKQLHDNGDDEEDNSNSNAINDGKEGLDMDIMNKIEPGTRELIYQRRAALGRGQNTSNYQHKWTLADGTIIAGGPAHLHKALYTLQREAARFKAALARRVPQYQITSRISTRLQSSMVYDDEEDEEDETDESDESDESDDDNRRSDRRSDRRPPPSRRGNRRGRDDDDDDGDNSYGARNTESESETESEDYNSSEDDRRSRRPHQQKANSWISNNGRSVNRPKYRDETTTESESDSGSDSDFRRSSRRSTRQKPVPPPPIQGTRTSSRRMVIVEDDSEDNDEELRLALIASKKEADERARAQKQRAVILDDSE